MEDGLGAANTRRAMSRRVERVERGVTVHDETLMRLASVHAIGAITAQRWAARQPVPAWRVCYNWTQIQPGSDGMKVLLTGGAGDLGWCQAGGLAIQYEGAAPGESVWPYESAGLRNGPDV